MSKYQSTSLERFNKIILAYKNGLRVGYAKEDLISADIKLNRYDITELILAGHTNTVISAVKYCNGKSELNSNHLYNIVNINNYDLAKKFLKAGMLHVEPYHVYRAIIKQDFKMIKILLDSYYTDVQNNEFLPTNNFIGYANGFKCFGSANYIKSLVGSLYEKNCALYQRKSFNYKRQLFISDIKSKKIKPTEKDLEQAVYSKDMKLIEVITEHSSFKINTKSLCSIHIFGNLEFKDLAIKLIKNDKLIPDESNLYFIIHNKCSINEKKELLQCIIKKHPHFLQENLICQILSKNNNKDLAEWFTDNYNIHLNYSGLYVLITKKFGLLPWAIEKYPSAITDMNVSEAIKNDISPEIVESIIKTGKIIPSDNHISESLDKSNLSILSILLSNRLQQKLSNVVIDKILNLIEKSPVLDQVAFFNDKNINIFFNNNDETVIAQKLQYNELKLNHLQKSYFAISGY